MPSVLVDAGPLVALIDRSDNHHQRCVDALGTIRDPLYTVWPAITEAMYLVRVSAFAQRALWDTINVIGLRFLEIGTDDCPRMRELMWKYCELPMDLADAALVRVAERDNLRRIFTLDRQDFEIYRPHRFGRFEIIP
ncbi:MAG: type II toxin-antitoxin system VapC family toxin [Candidatus Binatus sp.]